MKEIKITVYLTLNNKTDGRLEICKYQTLQKEEKILNSPVSILFPLTYKYVIQWLQLLNLI